MGGVQTKNVMTRREYDFSNLQLNGATEAVVVHRSLGVAYGERAELVVRVHGVDIQSDCSIKIRVLPVNLTPEEPDVDYLAEPVATVTIDDTSTAPHLAIEPFDPPFGPSIQLQVIGTCGSAQSGNIKVTISADIVCKD